MLGTLTQKARKTAYQTRLATHPSTDSTALIDFKDGEIGNEYRIGDIIPRAKVSTVYNNAMATAGVLSKDHVYTLTKAITHADVGATSLLLGTIPTGVTLTNIRFAIGTAFTTGVHVEVGTLADANAYAATTDFNLQSATTQNLTLTASISEETDVYAFFNPAEDLVAGAATVTLTYTTETSGVNISHADAGGSAVSLGTVPSGSDLITFKITVSEAFNGSSTLTVGTAADPDLFVAEGIDLTSATAQTATVTADAFGANTEVLVTVSGTSPTTGHASCTLVYTTPVAKAMTYADCDGTRTLLGSVPAVRTVYELVVDVTEAFSAGATIKVGSAANPDAVIATSEVDLTSDTEQTATVSVSVTPETPMYITLMGTGISAGEATVTLKYR